MDNASVPLYQRMMMQIIHDIEAGILKKMINYLQNNN